MKGGQFIVKNSNGKRNEQALASDDAFLCSHVVVPRVTAFAWRGRGDHPATVRNVRAAQAGKVNERFGHLLVARGSTVHRRSPVRRNAKLVLAVATVGRVRHGHERRPNDNGRLLLFTASRAKNFTHRQAHA